MRQRGAGVTAAAVLRFARFDPSDCGFPRPQVPVLPTFRRGLLRWRGAAAPAVPLHHHAAARYALHAAFRLAGCGPGGALLAPGYHCRTMIDGAIALQAPVAFYPLRPDLTFDLNGVEAAIAASAQPVRALVATHYFGFEQQDFTPLAQLCSARGIALVEDCSHLMVPAGGPRAARRGRYGVASPYKFFPASDGGLLWANDTGAGLGAPPRRRGLLSEARSLLDVWRRARGAVRVPAAPARAVVPDPRPGRDGDGGGVQLSDGWVAADADRSTHAVSRWIAGHADLDAIGALRRRHYRRWADAAAALPHARPLRAELGAGWVPYMFPLLLDRPERHFAALKRAGVPVWRWDDMAVSGCAVAAGYRTRLIHLPCHQSLTDADMAWMLAAVAAVLQ